MPIAKRHLSLYLQDVILRSGHKGLKRLFEDGNRKSILAEYGEKAENILAVLDRARTPENMNLPGFRLHPLKGCLNGFYAVTVRANYRVIFTFENVMRMMWIFSTIIRRSDQCR